MEPGLAQAEALAVLGEEVLAVGSNDEVLALSGPETEVIDLDGKVLLPGFVDSHNHRFNDSHRRDLTSEESQELALKGGTTTMANMFVREEFLDHMVRFEQEGKLKVRTSLYLLYTDNCGRRVGDWYLDYPPVLDPELMLRIPGVKLFSDGGSCMRGAYSFELPEGLAGC